MKWTLKGYFSLYNSTLWKYEKTRRDMSREVRHSQILCWWFIPGAQLGQMGANMSHQKDASKPCLERSQQSPECVASRILPVCRGLTPAGDQAPRSRSLSPPTAQWGRESEGKTRGLR